MTRSPRIQDPRRLLKKSFEGRSLALVLRMQNMSRPEQLDRARTGGIHALAPLLYIVALPFE